MALHHWELTGRQDCDNVIDIDELMERTRETMTKTGLGRDEALFVAVNQALGETREDWIAANREDAEADGLDVTQAFEAWRLGWRSCAVEIVKRYRRDEGED